MTDCGTDIMMADGEETFETITKTMCQWKERNILIIDGLTPLRYYTKLTDGELKTKQFNVVAYER